MHKWWRMTGSNRRPLACKASALPAELILHCLATSYSRRGNPPTTIGAEKLNFRVRDGNGCDLLAIITRHFKLDNLYYNIFIINFKRNFW